MTGLKAERDVYYRFDDEYTLRAFTYMDRMSERYMSGGYGMTLLLWRYPVPDPVERGYHITMEKTPDG